MRAASAHDVAGIRAVARAAWTATYGDLLRPETIDAALAEWYALDSLRSLVAADDAWCFVAYEGNELVGHASGQPVESDETEAEPAPSGDAAGGPTAELGAIYVAPDRQGQGFGTTLLERFEAAARERGCDAVRLRALSANDVGASFYESRGFEAVREESTELFGESVRETVFRRALE